jgi:hypothetical protein
VLHDFTHRWLDETRVVTGSRHHMIFGASLIYLILMLALVAAGRWRGGVAQDAAVSLLVWDALVNATYRYGMIETTGTMVIAFVYIGWCLMLVKRWNQHWLTLYLLFSGFAMLFWNAMYHSDAYLYKAVKNGIYCGMLIATGYSIWQARPRKTPEPSSDGS